MMQRKIRRQVLIPLSLTFIILIASFLYTSYRIRMEDYASGLTQRHHRVQNIFASLLQHRTREMTTIAEFIAEQRLFQNAMQAEDREALLKHGAMLFDRLSSQREITHFYFHSADGQTFLRVYQPENRESAASRFTKVTAMETGQPAAGLELGAFGTFTLRVVFPWTVSGELLGFIELGQEIDPILKELKNVTEIDFFIFLDKQNLDRQRWEDGMRLLGRDADWNLLADKVLIDKTLAMAPAAARDIIHDQATYETHGSAVEFGGRSYRARTFPLADASQRLVGDFVMLKDLTDDVSSFRAFVVQVVGFSLLLSGGLFAFAYRTLGLVDRRLAETQERLRQEFEKQAHTNRQLEMEIGERRRAEESLLGLNEHLEQRVQERTSELEMLNLEIEASREALEGAYKDLQAQQATILQQDKMACIGQLAASVAHDINNPIGFVAGNLDVLRKYWGRALEFVTVQQTALQTCAPAAVLSQVDESRKRLKIDHIGEEFPAVLAECLEGTDRVNRTVLNLKGFSRLGETEAEMTDIHECLDSTIGIVWNELRYKAEVKRDYGHVPLLRCYPQQLNQVFMNLLINASQAIDHWGEITIRTWADAENAHIAIGDSGCGIGVDHLPKIFEPFYTTKEAGVGTGLGLSIVRDLVRKHHGEIEVSSEVGRGTVFTIRLPLYGPEARHG